MLAAGLGAAVLPQFTAVRTPGVVVCEFDVPGSFVLRMVRRQGRPGPVPAVEAAVAAVRAAVLHAAEDYADSGTAPRDPVVTRLRDPSER
jgi:DNA-binding transcriptional LysR family regulator